MRHFRVYIPEWAHCMPAYGFSKRDAIARFRHRHGMLRMPNGYKIFPA
jgi:hypothetical protein